MQNLDNQVPELKDYNLYTTDPALQELVKKFGANWDSELFHQGAELGSEKILRIADDANSQSLHYAQHRSAFGKKLVVQPLMANVLTDMALEAQGAMTLAIDLSGRFENDSDTLNVAWRRIMTPVAKFWICKRAVEVCGEAMEVFGGNGYVETGPMGRLFRDAPVNSIWEGSGNVMCLDVLRAISRNPDEADLVFDQMQKTIADETRLLTQLAWLRNVMKLESEELEANARLIAKKFALLAQACLLIQHANPLIAEHFIATRTDPDWGAVLGASGGISVTQAQKILALSWSPH